MENVELSEAQVEEIKQQERADELETEQMMSKRKFANIVGRQSPSDFTPEIPVKEEKPAQKKAEPKKEELAQGDGEGEDKEKSGSEPAPLLPQALTETLSKVAPDQEIKTPEQAQEIISKIIAERDEHAQTIEAERKANERVYEIFESSDEMVALVRALNEGKGFMEALAASVDIDEAMADIKETDPEQYKKILRAQVEREKALEEQRAAAEKLEKQFQDNEKASRDAIESFQREKKLDPEQSKEFLAVLNRHFDEMVAGKVTPTYLNVIHKGLNYDGDLAAAKEQGRIEGRNEKIEAENAKKQGDNLPRIPRGQSRGADEAPTVSRGKRALAILAANSQSDF